MKKRLMSLLLAVWMIVGMLPAQAFAADAEGNTLYVGDEEGQYATLQEAYTDAEDGDTITLCKNIKSSSILDITKKVTIDLGEYNITSFGNVFKVAENGELLIKGSGTISGNHVITVDGGKVTVESGNISANTYGMMVWSGNVTILGGTIHGGHTGIYYSSGNHGIYGGTVSGGTYGVNVAGGECEITGGRFSHDPSEFVDKSAYSVTEQGDWFVVSSTGGTEPTPPAADYVAQVGEQGYESLSAAISAATSDQTIKLLSDIELTEIVTVPAGKNITLDLGGKTIESIGYSVFGDEFTDAVLKVCGELTITDSGEGGKICCNAVADLFASCGVYVDGGTLNIEGGTISGDIDDGQIYGVYVSGGTVNISGGTIEVTGNTNYAVAAGVYVSDGTANIKDGTIKVTGNTSCGVEVEYGTANTVNISGGKIEATGYGVKNWKTVNIEGTANISGGSGSVMNYKTANIKGGTFSGTIQNNGSGAIAISGGTFDTDPSAFVDESAYSVTEQDGQYVVSEKPQVEYVAQVGEQGFETLQAALASELSTNNTIVLLKDIDLGDNYLEVRKQVTIDLDGYKISGAGIVFNIYSGELTISGGTVSADIGAILWNGNLTAADMNISAETGGIYLASDNVIANIESGNISGGIYGVEVAGGTANISGGTVWGDTYGVNVSYNGIVNISDNANIGGSYGVHINGDYEPKANISGGTVSGSQSGVYVQKGTVNISGGTVSGSTYGVNVTGGELNISGGNIACSEFGVRIAGGKVNISGNAKISGESQSGVVVPGGELSISGGEISGSTYGVYVYGGNANIQSGTISGIRGVYALGGTVNIEGDADISGSSYGVSAGDSDATVNISGGYISGDESSISTNNGTLAITGGKFNTDPSEHVDLALYQVTTENDWFVVGLIPEYVAQVGEQKFETLHSAIESDLSTNNTITLLKDIDLGANDLHISKKVTIDLDGKTISGTGIVLNINIGGELTVTGGTVSGGGYGAVLWSGKLTATDMNISADICGIWLGSTDVIANISGCTVSGGEYGINVAGGECEITGGTITGTTRGVYVTGGTLSIESGNISGGSYGIQVEGGTAYIKGGTVSGGTYGVRVDGGTCVITGGKISGTDESSDSVCVTSGGSLSITGGTFSHNPSDHVDDGYAVIKDTATNMYVVSQIVTADVSIAAVDLADGYELAGAKLQILDSDGTVVDEWTSAGAAETIEGLTTGVEYTLKVSIAPKGYIVPTDTTFAIDEEGKVTSSGSVTENGVLLVEFSKTSVSVAAVDLNGGKKLEGAKLQIIDKNRNIVDEWTSAKEIHTIEGLNTNEEYTLRATVAPEGYTIPTDTTFTIDEEGKVTSTGTTNADGVLLVEFSKTSVSIAAVDLNGGKKLEGAKLQIIDKDGNVQEEWTSGRAAKSITGLKTNEEYKLKATVAPEGYVLPDATHFLIDERGQITYTGTAKDGVLLVKFDVVKFDFKFVNWDGTELQSGKLAMGETPVYGGETPTREATAQYSYTFTGWDKEIEPVTGEVTYTATYSETVNTYTVYWYDYSYEIYHEEVPYGTQPEYTHSGPGLKPANEMYRYNFAGWATEQGAEEGKRDTELPPVTGNVTYYAAYKPELRMYSIYFFNEVGDISYLHAMSVPYGETLVYDGATPTKESTAQYSYIFAGWDKPLATVTGDAYYYGTFTETLRSYDVTFVDWDDSTLKFESVPYGAAATAPTAPTREGYTFTGWDKAFNNVTGELTVKAQYTVNTHDIIYMVNGEEYDRTEGVAFGTAITLIDAPVKTGYTFSGWSEAPATMPDEEVTIEGTLVLTEYEVEVPTVEGGQVETDNENPNMGDDVTITVTPDAGKEIVEVVIRDETGDPIDVTDNGDGTYTYEQPAGNVEIEVTLKDSEYEVEIPTVDGGKVETDNENPRMGDDVTITVTPEVGKEIDKIVVKDENGKEIPVTKNEDGSYTYEQPAGNVEIEVTMKDSEYEVEIPTVEGGKVETDNENPKMGDDVTITVTPDAGKEIVEVVIRDETGKEIPVTQNSDGSYTYEQPAGDVTIEVTLKDILDDEPTYRPSIEATEGGETTVNKKNPEQGEKVTITTDPDKGYEVEDIIVRDKKGNEIKVTDNGDGTYSFKQPAGKVTIEVIYGKIEAESKFDDVKESDYFFDPVHWAVENGITNGVGSKLFAPNAVCTRAQVVTFLWRAAGSPEPESMDMPFVDVAPDAYYYKAVLWAIENGITNGTSATTFGPDAAVTRGQTVTFLWRAEGSIELDGMHGFADVLDGAYYHEAVLWAVENEVTNGTSTNTFSPNSGCTRGQIVTFLYRAMND